MRNSTLQAAGERAQATPNIIIVLVLFGLNLAGLVVTAQAQPGTNRRGADKEKDSGPALPSDERLLALHRDFVLKARRLAQEYERKKDWDKAKTVYGEILKLVPKYKPVKDRLDQLRQREATANRAKFTVKANEPWQNTGILVRAGKPITIRASGSWVFTLSGPVTPEGMAIPKELQKYKLGSLLGTIRPLRSPSTSATPQPRRPGQRPNQGKKKKPELKIFEIGGEVSFVAKETGILWVTMYDNDHSDNRGVLSLEIEGTFERAR